LTAHSSQIPCIALITGQQSGASSSNRTEKQKDHCLYTIRLTTKSSNKLKKLSNQEPKLKQTEKLSPEKPAGKLT
jgi:hypothetical protein